MQIVCLPNEANGMCGDLLGNKHLTVSGCGDLDSHNYPNQLHSLVVPSITNLQFQEAYEKCNLPAVNVLHKIFYVLVLFLMAVTTEESSLVRAIVEVIYTKIIYSKR